MKLTTKLGTLGFNHESNARSISIEIEEELADCNIYIDFELPNGDKFKSAMLTDLTKYTLPQSLQLHTGWLKCQLVAYRGDTFIKKSDVVSYYIDSSINATQDIIEHDGDVIEALQTGKADNIVYTNNVLQLMANGAAIGTPVTISGGVIPELIGTQEQPIYFINLDTGVYLLTGMCQPYQDAGITGWFTKQLTQVYKDNGKVYVLLFDTEHLQANHYIIDIEAVTYTRTYINLKQMALHVVPTDYQVDYFIPAMTDQYVNMESHDITSMIMFTFEGIEIPLNYYNKCVFKLGDTIPMYMVNGAPANMLWLGDSVANNELVLQANKIYTIEFKKDPFNLIATVSTRE